MQLRPREIFTIVRGLEDHEDTNTYYVRAVVRNARTDELIATVDLEDRGDGHRFAMEWQVPPDPANYGFYIVITTSVYTDAAYTTKSLYQDKYDTYLVAERPNPLLGLGGGGGGDDVDYKKIRKIIADELEKILSGKAPVTIQSPAPTVVVDMEPIQTEILNNKAGIINIQTQIKAIANCLNDIKEAINKLPVPKEIDFGSLQKWIGDSLVKVSQELNKQISKNTDLIVQDSQKAHEMELKNIKRELLKLELMVGKISTEGDEEGTKNRFNL